ncbi:MAG: restriction system-associated AAA family ATPase [Bacteroidota bacterium]
MKLVELELYSPFRGLQKDFTIRFNRPAKNINQIEPICFVGLNGSGKSNVMQVLAEIFFFLESVAMPDVKTYTKAETWFGFRIHYKLPITPRNALPEDDSNTFTKLTWRNIIITKEIGKEPVFEYYYDNEEGIKKVIDNDLFSKLLPNQIIGYSSGMNELVSIPFAKMDFYYLDVLKRKLAKSNSLDDDSVEQFNERKTLETLFEPDLNRLFFLDYTSNSLAVLANYIMRDFGIASEKKEMDVINELLSIKDILSFKASFNFRVRRDEHITKLLQLIENNNQELIGNKQSLYSDFVKRIELPYELRQTLHKLVDCSTTLRIISDEDIIQFPQSNEELRIELYFKVDENMKRAFRDKFTGGAMKMFGELYLLNLINIENYNESVQEQIKTQNLETNIHEFLPKVSTEDKVFHIDAIRFQKKDGTAVYYKQLSDGEHQYLQITGALMLIEENASLFLLDEPETHFNPEWRRKLISSLNEIFGIKLSKDPGMFIPQQEILLTTHSPFVVSDCQSENVYIFSRNDKGVQFRKPKINTYGASSHVLLKELFEKDNTIAETPNEMISKLEDKVEQAKTLSALNEIKDQASLFGDSVEKFILYYLINSKAKSLSKKKKNA